MSDFEAQFATTQIQSPLKAALASIVWMASILLMACLPALVIVVWRWAL